MEKFEIESIIKFIFWILNFKKLNLKWQRKVDKLHN